jgi:hypothetical protein
MKRLLSLSLALALCLSLTVPALAAGKAGDTTVTDSIGNTYTLSTPILYTVSRAQAETIDRNSMKMFLSGFESDKEAWTGAESDLLDKHFWSRMNTVYAVPENTIITLPSNVGTSAVCELDFAWEGDTAHASEYSYINYPGMQEITLNGSGYILGVEIWDENLVDETPNANNSVPHDIITAPESDSYVYGDSIIYFYVPENAKAENPFPASTSTSPSTPTTPNAPASPVFTDVAANAYYGDGVNWAVEKSITSGTSATTFSPNQTCTTAQILTFLWRAKGSPEPTSKTNPFTDVKESDYFYKSALWAKENNILPITNTNSTTFNGNTPCTRGMAVLYIWRASGFPAAEKSSNFTDVAATTLYAPAVDWALEAGVTSGTSATTFSPDTTCTRAQIVTFLYRALAK